MSTPLETHIAWFDNPNALSALAELQRGIEKESLRINAAGHLSQQAHPQSLGSALTHPYITTDFSEALLEFITPVRNSITASLTELDDVHRFVYPQLQQEQLWTASMPCVLADQEKIPVAQYGSSNVATMKTAYRWGLVHRYGAVMQTIAGIHYNFSLPDSIWELLRQREQSPLSLQDYKTAGYFRLIRNFRRYVWLLVYLYGASPALCKSFLGGASHQLQAMDDGTLYLPHATSLRMGDLGYQSSAQSHLNICYNSIDSYIDTLHRAIRNKHADYEKIGIKDASGYKQLSTALLQIENEFYSPIRPKRVTQSGEIPLGALKNRGVEYIEVRCIDVNPYLPLGIDADQIRFIDSFLIFCLLESSPPCDEDEQARIRINLKRVVNQGRDPELTLLNSEGEHRLRDWAQALLAGIAKTADLLDRAENSSDHHRVCEQQLQKINDPRLTPSSKMLDDMRSEEKSYFRFARDLAQEHADYFLRRPLEPQRQQFFESESAQSLLRQADIEAADKQSFEEYLQSYYAQYDQLA